MGRMPLAERTGRAVPFSERSFYRHPLLETAIADSASLINNPDQRVTSMATYSPSSTSVSRRRMVACLRPIGSSYAIDEQTAIKVVDGVVEVISEGHWNHFAS
ncbi:MAG: hypothetical protein KDD91_06160 [Caldilinea sp.]|nr:hypothetical protein [Caldilinea sp.]